MKTIDPNLAHQMAYKKVKLTFQQWAYKGTAIYTIGGNTSGTDLLRSIMRDLEDYPLEVLLDKNNCKLNFPLKSLGGTDEEWYQAVLKDDEGNTLEIEGETSELSTMLVGIEVISVEKE